MRILKQSGESIVMCRSEPHRLRYPLIVEGSVKLYDPGAPDHIGFSYYQEGIDYTIHYESGIIIRTATSGIPDWSRHPIYGMERFDHRSISNCSNINYTLYIDYEYVDTKERLEAAPYSFSSDNLSRFLSKLSKGEPVTYVVFGDSISMGAEINEGANIFYNRFAETLKRRFPEASIDIRMKAVGGENSRRALERLHRDVIELKPNLVSIGYGMNDQNRQDNGLNSVAPEEYGRNIGTMVREIRANTDADIVLITPCLPNPRWVFASSNTEDYAAALHQIRAEYGVALADLRKIWLEHLAAGKTHESLLVNNVNHPNNYGHFLYAQAMEQLLK